MSKNLPPHPFLDLSPILAGGTGLIANTPLIELMASDEQIKKWLPKIASGEYLTAYGQTELTHGSDVQSLQTTAEYITGEEVF